MPETTDLSSRHRGVVEKRAEALLRGLISDMGMSPGDRIPSERVLAERFDISRMTVRKAVQRMVDQGQLERRGTAGTYLPEVAVVRPLSKRVSTAISEVVGRRGKRPGARLLFFEQAMADTNAARRLRLEEGAPVIAIKRLRLSDGTPFCVETSYLPSDMVPGLVAADLMNAPSLYGLLRERYGLTFGKSDFHVSVANVPEGEAGLLDLPSSEPCLLMRSVVYDVNERPVESLVSWNHPDRVAFESLQADGNALESVYTDWARSPQGTAPDGRN